jgi:hypothetical protein
MGAFWHLQKDYLNDILAKSLVNGNSFWNFFAASSTGLTQLRYA